MVVVVVVVLCWEAAAGVNEVAVGSCWTAREWVGVDKLVLCGMRMRGCLMEACSCAG